MNLSVGKRDRLRQIAQEAAEILGGCLHPDGSPMTFAELEDECIAAGDLFSTAVLQQRVNQRPTPEAAPVCPTCERPGEVHPEEPRVLQTDRGDMDWMEPTYYCRCCRRSFFPSLG